MTNFVSSSEIPSKSHPLLCSIKERYHLTKNSDRTCHVSLDLNGQTLAFNPGDSLAVLPENCHELIEEYLKALDANREELIFDARSQTEMTIETFLKTKANLLRINSNFLKKALEYAPSSFLKDTYQSLLSPEKKEDLHHFIHSHEPLDVLKELRTKLPLQEAVNSFGPLLPRFYSIASSPSLYPQEIHLTVALTSHQHKNKTRYGVASHFLCKQAILHKTKVPIYIQKAQHFHLPEDGSISIIMVGPGTGIAPYKAFLEERIAKRSKGKNWLIFGERNQATDFFYEEFLLKLVEEQKLILSTAFSRDQPEKIYVQHRMYENRKALWQWLQEGAIFYVCGNASHMAKDVEAMLQLIAEEEGKLDHQGSREYIKELRKAKRYLADVY